MIISVLAVSYSQASEPTDGGRILNSSSPPTATIDVRYIRFESYELGVEMDSPVILGGVFGSSFKNGFEEGVNSIDSQQPGDVEVYQRILHIGDEFAGGSVRVKLSAKITGTWNWDRGTLDDGSYFEDYWSLAVNSTHFGSFWYNANSTATEFQNPGPIFTHGISGATNTDVTFMDEVQINDVVVNTDGNLVLDFTGATTQTSELAEISATAYPDLPYTYIYEIDVSAGVTTVGAALSLQMNGTNSGSLTSMTGNTIVTENPPGSGMWDMTFIPGATSVTDVLELRILEGTSFKLDFIATSTLDQVSTSTTVSSSTWTDGTFVD